MDCPSKHRRVLRTFGWRRGRWTALIAAGIILGTGLPRATLAQPSPAAGDLGERSSTERPAERPAGKRVGSLAGPVQGAGWPDPVANDVVPYQTSGLSLGPLLGGVRHDSVRVWVQTESPTAFEIVYDTQLPLDQGSPSTAGETTAARDGTGVVSLVGLQPDTRYYYGVRVAGVLADTRRELGADWPSFKTLPTSASFRDDRYNPRGLFNVTFGVGHCASQEAYKSGGQYGRTPAYDRLREHGDELMFCLVNGDVIYEERRDGTLRGVRDNYRVYFQRGRSFSGLFRETPALFTFDDHDVGWDIHGCGQVGLGEGPHLIRDTGLRAYEEYLSWANYRGPQTGRIRLGTGQVQAGSPILSDPTADFSSLDPATVSTIHLGNYTRSSDSIRRAEAPRNAGVYRLVRVLDRHRLEIAPTPGHDEQLSYSIGTHHYYDWQIANCHFFALDTRGERSTRNPRNRRDGSRFILGPDQMRWFVEGVRRSTADFIFVVSPDPWMIYHTAAHVGGSDQDDKGDGFPSFLHQREELLRVLERLDKPVLIFTGDVHASASVQISERVWEFMCGPLGSTGHPLGTLGNPPRGGDWSSMGRPVQIRWVTGFPNNLPYQRIRNTYYGVVQVNNVLRTGRPDGPGYQYCAYDRPQVVVRWHDGYTGRLVYAESILGPAGPRRGAPDQSATGQEGIQR